MKFIYQEYSSPRNWRTSYQTLEMPMFQVHEPKLFNVLPPYIRNMTKCEIEDFKEKLDNFLAKIPHQPYLGDLITKPVTNSMVIPPTLQLTKFGSTKRIQVVNKVKATNLQLQIWERVETLMVWSGPLEAIVTETLLKPVPKERSFTATSLQSRVEISLQPVSQVVQKLHCNKSPKQNKSFTASSLPIRVEPSLQPVSKVIKKLHCIKSPKWSRSFTATILLSRVDVSLQPVFQVVQKLQSNKSYNQRIVGGKIHYI